MCCPNLAVSCSGARDLDTTLPIDDVLLPKVCDPWPPFDTGAPLIAARAGFANLSLTARGIAAEVGLSVSAWKHRCQWSSETRHANVGKFGNKAEFSDGMQCV